MTEQIIKDWTADLKRQILENYQSYGLKASGRFEKNLSEFYEQGKDNVRAGLTAPYYSYYLEYGRGKTSPTGPYQSGRKLYEIIEEWINVKGITIKQGSTIKQAAYAIAQKIHREGIKVPNQYNKGNFLSSVINQNSVNTLIKNLGTGIVKNITSEILKEFKNGDK